MGRLDEIVKNLGKATNENDSCLPRIYWIWLRISWGRSFTMV